MATNEAEEAIAQLFERINDVIDEPLQILAPISGYAKMPLVSLEQAVKPLVHILPNVQSQAYVAKQRCTNPADNLTSDESAAIMLYTMGGKPLDQCFYVVLNNTLRSPDREGKLEPWFLYLRLFLNALFRLPPIHEVVFRGVKLDISKNYVKGKKVVWWGFSSCTTLLDVLESNLFLGKTGARTIFNIQCETIRDICKHSYFPKENEVLLLAATEFEVISCLDQGDLCIIQLKEVRSPHPLLEPVPVVGSLPKIPFQTNTSSYPVPSQIITANPVPSQPITANLPNRENRDAEIKRLITKERNSSEMNLQRQKLTDEDMAVIASSALHSNKTLTTLNLWMNQIGDQGVKYLTDALTHNKTFTTVNLSNNKIGPEGAKYLSDALQQNTTLTELRLAENQIGPEGAKCLRDALRVNKTLTTLNLSSNKIEDQGVEYLSDVLVQNKTLTTLNLWNNGIGDQGARYLSNALQQNTTLTKLDLARNQIKHQGAQYLSDALLPNKTLTSLDLSNNQIGEQGAKHLIRLKKNNKILEIGCDENLSGSNGCGTS